MRVQSASSGCVLNDVLHECHENAGVPQRHHQIVVRGDCDGSQTVATQLAAVCHLMDGIVVASFDQRIATLGIIDDLFNIVCLNQIFGESEF